MVEKRETDPASPLAVIVMQIPNFADLTHPTYEIDFVYDAHIIRGTNAVAISGDEFYLLSPQAHQRLKLHGCVFIDEEEYMLSAQPGTIIINVDPKKQEYTFFHCEAHTPGTSTTWVPVVIPHSTNLHPIRIDRDNMHYIVTSYNPEAIEFDDLISDIHRQIFIALEEIEKSYLSLN